MASFENLNMMENNTDVIILEYLKFMCMLNIKG